MSKKSDTKKQKIELIRFFLERFVDSDRESEKILEFIEKQKQKYQKKVDRSYIYDSRIRAIQFLAAIYDKNNGPENVPIAELNNFISEKLNIKEKNKEKLKLLHSLLKRGTKFIDEQTVNTSEWLDKYNLGNEKDSGGMKGVAAYNIESIVRLYPGNNISSIKMRYKNLNKNKNAGRLAAKELLGYYPQVEEAINKLIDT